MLIDYKLNSLSLKTEMGNTDNKDGNAENRMGE